MLVLDASGLFANDGDTAGIGILLIVQYGSMLVAALALGARYGGPERESPRPAAVAGGAIAGIGTVAVASGVGALLLEFFPSWDVSALEALGDAFVGGSAGARALVVVGVVIGAPLAEEVFMRGTLWGVLRRRLSPRATFLVSSAIFACWHLHPFHILSITPTAFLLGWLRLRSGSLVPGIVAHMANNGIGAALLLTLGSETDAPFEPLLFIGGLVVCATAVTLVASRGSRTASSTA